MTTAPSRIGGRSENGGRVLGWSPATISARRSTTICAASVARIITNIVALRSHSGRTTTRSMMTPTAATATMATAAATGKGRPIAFSAL